MKSCGLNINPKWLVIISLFAFLASAACSYAGSSFRGAKLEQACVEYVRRQIGGEAEISAAQRIDDQQFDMSGIKAKCSANPSALRGLCYVALEFYQGSELIRRVDVPMRVRIYREAAVCAEPLLRGRTIATADIASKKVEITQFKEEDLPPAEEIAGAKLTRSLPKGGVILRSFLEKPKVIKRGDKITVVVQSGAVSVRTYGFALQDAGSGESVKVKTDTAVLQGVASESGSVFIVK